jgi:Zn-dependent peptidase ImmA (M78 family)
MSAEIPYLSHTEIQAKVDSFRAGLEADQRGLPLDSAYIAEINLRLKPIPLKNLWNDLDIDAALTADLKGFYVDEQSYECVLERVEKNHWMENRLRFSIAHEIGHYVLHGPVISGLKYNDIHDYLAWRHAARSGPSPEYQADEFAGRLLVPGDILLREYDRVTATVAKEHKNWRRMSGTRERVARLLAPRFGVNYQVIETRFDREDIWRAE